MWRSGIGIGGLTRKLIGSFGNPCIDSVRTNKGCRRLTGNCSEVGPSYYGVHDQVGGRPYCLEVIRLERTREWYEGDKDTQT